MCVYVLTHTLLLAVTGHGIRLADNVFDRVWVTDPLLVGLRVDVHGLVLIHLGPAVVHRRPRGRRPIYSECAPVYTHRHTHKHAHTHTHTHTHTPGVFPTERQSTSLVFQGSGRPALMFLRFLTRAALHGAVPSRRVDTASRWAETAPLAAYGA